ncbi:hypothetical protein ACVWXN_008402 [Bradyrhizobium sp. i1.4.4]
MAGGSASDALRQPLLEACERDGCDNPRDDRLEMVPQPGFDQEDDRQQDPDRLK